jgi:hypothetical protein
VIDRLRQPFVTDPLTSQESAVAPRRVKG